LILVLCGTQKQDFSRMIRVVEALADEHEVVIQAGYTKHKSNKMRIFDFTTSDELAELYDRSDYIVTHGGAGSIFQAVKAGKKTLVFPRLEKYGEHVDDHQLQLAGKLAELGYLQIFADGDDIKTNFANLQNFVPKTYDLTGEITDLVAKKLNEWLQNDFLE